MIFNQTDGKLVEMCTSLLTFNIGWTIRKLVVKNRVYETLLSKFENIFIHYYVFLMMFAKFI